MEPISYLNYTPTPIAETLRGIGTKIWSIVSSIFQHIKDCFLAPFLLAYTDVSAFNFSKTTSNSSSLAPTNTPSEPSLISPSQSLSPIRSIRSLSSGGYSDDF